MKLSIEFLEEQSACSVGIEWFKNQKEKDSMKVLKKLIKEDRLLWANWLIVRVMTYNQYVSYAIFAAEQVIDIYENKYPNDKRPRKAIEAAKACLKNPSDKNKKAAAADATDAADAAFIVRAVNFHQELINALKYHHVCFKNGDDIDCRNCDLITKAEGK